MLLEDVASVLAGAERADVDGVACVVDEFPVTKILGSASRIPFPAHSFIAQLNKVNIRLGVATVDQK